MLEYWTSNRLNPSVPFSADRNVLSTVKPSSKRTQLVRAKPYSGNPFRRNYYNLREENRNVVVEVDRGNVLRQWCSSKTQQEQGKAQSQRREHKGAQGRSLHYLRGSQ